MLNSADLYPDRYSRQVLFRGIGPSGQQALSCARITIVGVGATGAATASLLARAGVGQITLIDRDFVEPSNLQRQILFDEADAEAALPKAIAAQRKIAAFNSAIEITAVVADLVPGNIHELLGSAHLVLDCTDNFETRFLLNDYAVEQFKPWIYAAAIGAYAATMTILPNGVAGSLPLTTKPTACLACIFPTPPSGPVETCDTAGILGMAVNLAASIQSTEALKLLTHQPHLLRRTLLAFDLWTNERSEINAGAPDPLCPVCTSDRPRVLRFLEGKARPHITLCGRNSVQIHEHHRPTDLLALQERLREHPDITGLRSSEHLLRFERGPHTVTVFPDGRALIQGTTDPGLARSIYARFLGS